MSDFLFRAFFCLFFFSGFSCLVGLINPQFVLWWLRKERHTRERVLITYLTLTILSLIIVGLQVISTGEISSRKQAIKKKIDYKKSNTEINKMVKKYIHNVYGEQVTFLISKGHLVVYYRASEDVTMNMIRVFRNIPHQAIILDAHNLFYTIFTDEMLDCIRQVTIYPRMKIARMDKNGEKEEIWEDIAAIQMSRHLAKKINWTAVGTQTMPLEEFEDILERHGYIRWLY